MPLEYGVALHPRKPSMIHVSDADTLRWPAFAHQLRPICDSMLDIDRRTIPRSIVALPQHDLAPGYRTTDM